MAEPIYLLLGLHHHQPVGNFEGVFADAFKRCYRPVLEAFERHPSIRFSLHHSGPLLDWAAKHEGDYLDRVAALTTRGQLEILGGGYYEPILPILKPSDALGQIGMMQRFWEKRTGKKPAGMWLAERVWEPSLAALLHDAGISFTILDDQHFRHAGQTGETLFGYWRTERAGKSVSIFPSDKMLRYLIPFKMPEDVIGHLLHLQDRFPGKAVTYGDDGEKFGVWPGTYDWVIAKGWLERFLAGLEKAADRIATIAFSEYMGMRKPEGRIYLPTASYSEMLEWAMPAESIVAYNDAKISIEQAGLWEKSAPFFRGGYWDNFLTKYPESNLIHKRSIHVSDKIDAAEAKGAKLTEARSALYRAQCNCAYWHGLFGGLYLNYLRHALYQNLIDADSAVDRALEGEGPFTRLEIADVDRDGFDEAILSNEKLLCIVKPDAGGSLAELDWRPARFNILNTLARRFEAYHAAKNGHRHAGDGAIPSIHDLGKDIGGLEKLLTYDRLPRYAFIDHAFDIEPRWQSILEKKNDDSPAVSAFPCRIASHRCGADGASVVLAAECVTASGASLAIEKEYRLGAGGHLDVHYSWRHTGKGRPPMWLATEINFTLLAGHDRDRYYQWKGVEPGEVFMDAVRSLEGVSQIDAVDRAFGFRLRIEADAPRALVMPVETVSQSEKGFDRMYQGSAIWLAWQPDWSGGNAKFSVGISIETI
ncbi:MAG: alpha-amylase/4-alpha-glucanotransferase domain-containing protein [Pseudomonadota bacterium]